MPDVSARPDRTTTLTRNLAVASLLALIVLGLAWELWLAPTGQRTWALKVLPLAVPLTGFLKYRMRTYRWVSLLVWLYFTEGVVRATSESGISAVLATLQVLLCVVLFTACAWHVRWRLKRGHAAAQAEAGADQPPAAGRP
ncbi:DUF2069 domain-containing protein [uncultured Aquincola sp.]|uniref:DUF2069 domain-containing protein n=1 Tax=uncultured Aquincola sp. TaxID=886556 RepID=UPI0032B1BDF7